MRFSYFQNLNADQKVIYEKSDRVGYLPLSHAEALQAVARELQQAVSLADRAEIRRSLVALCRAICEDLKVTPPKIQVLMKRPSNDEEELHGLYLREQGELPEITVWIYTAKNKKVVAFRTLLRTVAHEICHHLDYSYLMLGDSFHTMGFFRRESNLVALLIPTLLINEKTIDSNSLKGRVLESSNKKQQLVLPFRS